MRHGGSGICPGIEAIAVHTYAALLHSIVLGPGKRVVMADLRSLAETAGFQNPRTLGATGNLIVDSDGELKTADVETKLERAIENGFGKHIDVIARTAGDWLNLAVSNPFSMESGRDGSLVTVRVMRTPLPQNAEEALEPWRGHQEKVKVVNGDLWIAFKGQPSQSRLLSRLTVKHLGIGTLRNWNTVAGLAKLISR
jgi:uncharacterized protein (DUF1697 family)